MAAASRAPKLKLSNVSKEFAAPGTGQRALAVADVSLDIESGEFICVVGPSGCGKSTVMNMIAGLAEPSSGTIEKDGMPIRGPGADRGVMFQDYALFPWLNVHDNIGFELRHGTPGNYLPPSKREDWSWERVICGLCSRSGAAPRSTPSRPCVGRRWARSSAAIRTTR